MMEFLKALLSLSLSGTLLILLLSLLQPLYRHRLSRRWQYYVWLIVIARLLLPFSFLPDLIPRQATLLPQAGSMEAVVPELDAPRLATVPGPVAQPGPHPLEFLWVIWLVVAIALFIRKITVYQGFVKYVKAGKQEITDLAQWEELGKLMEQSGVRQRVELYANGLISSPLLIGFFRPCIMLPTAQLPEADFHYTILHELTHHKRRDMFYKWLVQLTVSLHWFNPFMYRMEREISRACELSCDEAVIGKLDEQGKRAYGDTLLNALRSGGSYRSSLASVTLSESHELLKERLDAIMGYRQKSKAAAALTLAVTILFATGAAAAGGPITPQRAIGAVSLPEFTQELTLSLDIENGGVVIVPSSSDDITAQYDAQYYDVGIQDDNGAWTVSVAGKVARMGDTNWVRLHVPYAKYNMDVNVRDGNFQYDLPENGSDVIHVVSENAGVQFTSANRYANSSIALTAAQREYLEHRGLAYPKYFNKSGDGITYENGTGDSQIRVELTGYGSVEFMEREPLYTDGNGVYYLFASGATLADKPSVSVTPGQLAVVLVEKDGYVSIAPLENTRHLAEDIRKQCEVMLQKKQITQEQAWLILGQAERISKAASNTVLSAQSKEYTADDLRRLGITGLRVDALDETIVLRQGGSSLRFQYPTTSDIDYAISSKDSTVFHLTTLEKETVSAIELRRLNRTGTGKTGRTLTITLPDDPEFTRSIQLYSTSGNIRLEQCSSSSMLQAVTDSGNIVVQNCSSPLLRFATNNGQIAVNGCKMDTLQSKTLSGNMTVQLAGQAESYRMHLDTGTRSTISVNGKEYPGGVFTLHESSSNTIHFDSKDGSLTVTEL